MAHQRTYTIGGGRMTAGEVWTAYVGDQGTEEFVRESGADATVGQAAASYAADLPRIMADAGEPHDPTDEDEIAEALAEYIERDIAHRAEQDDPDDGLRAALAAALANAVVVPVAPGQSEAAAIAAHEAAHGPMPEGEWIPLSGDSPLAIPAELRAARARLGMTQADLADALGMERNAYGRYERGERTPRNPAMLRLALERLAQRRPAADREAPD